MWTLSVLICVLMAFTSIIIHYFTTIITVLSIGTLKKARSVLHLSGNRVADLTFAGRFFKFESFQAVIVWTWILFVCGHAVE